MSEDNWEKSETEYLPLMNLATGRLNEINPRSMESPRVNSPTLEQMGPCGPRGPASLPSQGQGSEQGTLEAHPPRWRPRLESPAVATPVYPPTSCKGLQLTAWLGGFSLQPS